MIRRPTPRRPPVDLARNVIQGASGGIVAGALVGLVEAVYLLATIGMPDLVSPFYAVVLYGVVGLPLGVCAGVVLTGWEKVTHTVEDPTAWAFGFAGATAPLLLYILHALANRVVYLERGVPSNGKVAVLGLAVGIALLAQLLWPFILHGGVRVLLKAKGLLLAWGGLMFITGAIAEAPLTPDPRAGWGHGKKVPGALADKPNVMVLMVDALRADHLGAYGAEGDPTPTMDTLAADGIVFDNAFAQASSTRASSASLLASRLPSQLADEGVTWAEVLRTSGVTTGALVNDGNLSATFNGFDTFYYAAPEYRFWATESVSGLTLYQLVGGVAERVLGGSMRVERYYQPADVVLADARRFVEANRDSRWALLVHLMEPHDPYFEHPSADGSGLAHYNGVGFGRTEAPEGADAEHLRRVYRDEVVFLDRMLAPFVEWMRESGVYDDTLVVLTSDHGTELGEHGGFWHGTTLYDEQIHVPLVVKLPGNPHAGTRAPWQVRLLDVAPTLTGALGVKAHPSWEGHDLLVDVAEAEGEPAVGAGEPREEAGTGEPGEEAGTGEPGEEAAAGEPSEEAGQEPPAPEPASEPPPRPPPAESVGSHPRDRVAIAEQHFEGNAILAIQRDGFKYIRANEGNPRGLPTEALFDLVEDPGETANLMGSSATISGYTPEDVAAALVEELPGAISSAAEEPVPAER
ncbi:MAG: sulfatase [Deltaproteobacteria bacterium]|nr:sulfatase [Deltaproteobacteria bacterium]MBW2253252.1 sulfatase [Deltaproteobacteria bacterium]